MNHKTSSTSRNYTTLCSTSFLMAGRLVIARNAYCCLCFIVLECFCLIWHCGESIPEAKSSFSLEIMILLLHNLLVSQTAMQGLISWRDFILCHMLLTGYVYMCTGMYLYMHCIEMYCIVNCVHAISVYRHHSKIFKREITTHDPIGQLSKEIT